MIFDAGEGSLRQSTKATQHSMMATTRIFITHMHADHILGLPSILLQAGMMTPENVQYNEPVHIYGPPGLHSYLVAVVALTHSVCSRPFVVHELEIREAEAKQLAATCPGNKSPWRNQLHHYRSPELAAHVSHLQGGSSFERRVEYANGDGTWDCLETASLIVKARLIAHKIPCYGFVVEERPITGELLVDKVRAANIALGPAMGDVKQGLPITGPDGVVHQASEFLGPSKKGRKITILGDTSNAKNIVDLARDSDLVVHESSFDSTGTQLAAKSGHATPQIAAKFALSTNAKRLIVNHIGAAFVSATMPPVRSAGVLDNNNARDGKEFWKFDTDIQDEIRRLLGRPEHCVIARDFMSVHVPIGGYKMDDDTFKLSFYVEENHAVHEISKLELSPQIGGKKNFSPAGRSSMFTRILSAVNANGTYSQGEPQQVSEGGDRDSARSAAEAAQRRANVGRNSNNNTKSNNRSPRHESPELFPSGVTWGIDGIPSAEAPASNVRSVFKEHNVEAKKSGSGRNMRR